MFAALGGIVLADINKEIGKRIRQYREKRNVTQEALAFEANLHRAYLGQIERGEKNIGLINLQKIAKALNTKMAILLKNF
jgi:transcriptional regulator with XRE-family HTH domain